MRTDAKKNAAADRVIRLMLGEEAWEAGWDESEGIPKTLLDEAGTALARRFYCALREDMNIIVVPISYFDATGRWFGEPAPIDHLLPGCDAPTSCTWVLMDETKKAADVIKYLQAQGFVWNEAFQDKACKKLTKEIKAGLEKPAAKGSKPQSPKR